MVWFAVFAINLLILHVGGTLSQTDTPSPLYGPPEALPPYIDNQSGSDTNLPIETPSTMYGPPQNTTGGNKPEPEAVYGVPGFVPGEPLGDYASYESNSIKEGNSGQCLNSNLEDNKMTVMSFYQDVFGDKKFNLVDKYYAENIINHNPMVLDGRNGLRKLLEGPLGQGPPTTIDIKRISAENDLVWVHLRFPVPALGVTYAIIDIFRVGCDGLIEEHWDVVQDTNVKTDNPHPFF